MKTKYLVFAKKRFRIKQTKIILFLIGIFFLTKVYILLTHIDIISKHQEKNICKDTKNKQT